MLPAFLIMLREGIESALIVGIIASYLKQTGNQKALPAIWWGVGIALVLCLGVGVFIYKVTGEMPQQKQELFVGIIGIIAAVILTSMVFWMKKAARSIGDTLKSSVDKALNSPWKTLALVTMSFLAVAREGLESAFFLISIVDQGSDLKLLLGAFLGVFLAVFIGWAIYNGGVRLNLRLFFKWTGIFILFVAAGLLANSLGALHEAGVWNHLQAVVFDMSRVLPDQSVLGVVLSGVLGYEARPTMGQALIWCVYLVPALFLYLKAQKAAHFPNKTI